MQPSMEVAYLDTDGRRSVLRCPALPSPLNLLAAVLDWDAMPWRDRLAAMKLAGPLHRARRELLQTGKASAVPPGTVTEWLAAHGQRRKLRDWLWEPLAVAALNQSPDLAAAAPFVRVLAQMFGARSHRSLARAAVEAAAPDVCRTGARLHPGAGRQRSIECSRPRRRRTRSRSRRRGARRADRRGGCRARGAVVCAAHCVWTGTSPANSNR